MTLTSQMRKLRPRWQQVGHDYVANWDVNPGLLGSRVQVLTCEKVPIPTLLLNISRWIRTFC